MARLPGDCVPGTPRHIIQRGNNPQPCFAPDQDRAACALARWGIENVPGSNTRPDLHGQSAAFADDAGNAERALKDVAGRRHDVPTLTIATVSHRHSVRGSL